MNETALQIAQALFARGWSPLPVPHKSKNPGFKNWQNFNVTSETLANHFNGRAQNIGVLLGDKSHNLIDVDLDSPEAVRLAPYLLPATNAIFGRAGSRSSHRLYYVATQTRKFLDSTATKSGAEHERAVLVEVRSSGMQTLFPGSTHPSGERIEWEQSGEPTYIEAMEFESCVSRLAAGALLARYWCEGKRHELSLALAGALLRASWTVDETKRFIEAVCHAAGDEEARGRVQNVETTAAKIKEGAAATGWNTLKQFIDERIVRQVRDWLGVRETSSGANEKSTHKQSTSETIEVHGYTIIEDGFAFKKATRDGVSIVRLCNFTAFVTNDSTEDDGAEARRVYEVRGRLAGSDEHQTISISADDFAAMKWVDKLLGASATIYAGRGEHVRCAVKLLSKEITAARVFTHTGWRRVGEEWFYLHGGGAIGASGNRTDIAVRLPASLDALTLVCAAQEQDLIYAVRHHLNALAVAPSSITFPLFGGVWAAILGDCDFALHLAGESGAGKSELAAIAQAHFGAGFDREHLPAAWASTANSLERLAHAAKDALLVVDDFAPTGSATDAARLHREADRLIRAQGNHAGRLRLRSDSSFNSARAPRGLILSTGEDVPHGQSLRARLLVLEVARANKGQHNAIDFAALTECQKHAREGVYANVTATFVRWLAARYETVPEQSSTTISALRAEFAARHGEAHKRYATTAAKLIRAWNIFLDFALETKAINDHEREELSRQVWEAISQAANAQEQQQTSQDAAARFVELIAAALSTGLAHLADCSSGGQPTLNHEAYGWRDCLPQGKRIGWTDGDDIFLQPDMAYATANELGGKAGGGISVTPTTLWKRLNERGWLRREQSQDSLQRRVTVERKRTRVIALSSDFFTQNT